MIDEIKTFYKFRYYSIDLAPKSSKKIVVICNNCGLERIIRKDSYRDLCKSCVQKGKKLSEKTKNKIGKSGKHHPMFGKHHSKESKEKNRQSHIGKPGMKGENNPMFGRTGDKHPLYGKTGKDSPNWKGGKRMSNAKMHAKRREFGFNPLNNPFIGCEGHHINFDDVIFITKELHRSISHNNFTGKNMKEINKLAFKFMEMN